MFQLNIVGPDLYVFVELNFQTKSHKNQQLRQKFPRFQALCVYLVIFARFYWFCQVFFLILIRFLRKKCIGQNFIFLEFLMFCHDFTVNIMGIETKDPQSIFRKKVSVSFIVHIMCSKIPLDTLIQYPTIDNWYRMFLHWLAPGSRLFEWSYSTNLIISKTAITASFWLMFTLYAVTYCDTHYFLTAALAVFSEYVFIRMHN